MKTEQILSIQDIARRQIETTKKVYLISPERMFSEYNGEKENIKNYNGRQLLEMLQNADDAALEATAEKKVLIKLLGNKLIIANTGYPFSEEGLKSIFHSHLSPKEAKENQIGKKGLGFRSILSWADKVVIKSHELLVAFSQNFSKKVLNELLEDQDFKREFNKLNRKHKSPISTLVCPDVESANISSFDGMDEYDTIVEIDLHEKAIKEVKKQVLEDLDGEVLLFLNNLEKIEIDINGEILSFAKTILSKSSIKIETYNNGKDASQTWNINTHSGRFDDIDKSYELSLAWQDDLAENKDVIYSYFRTKVPIKCKGILHGSFELNADRNLIIDDEENYNKKLVALLPELIAQTAENISKNEFAEVNYKAINFLHIELQSLNHLVSTFELSSQCNLSIKQKKIFPAISNEYIAWNDDDKPVYYKEEEFALYLTPAEFPDILLCCDNAEDEELIQRLEPTSYKIEKIIQDINQKKDAIPVARYASLIVSIHEYVDDVDDIRDVALLYDDIKNLLKFDEAIFLPNAATKYSLPPDIGVQIISKELADNLVTIINCDNYVGLQKMLFKYKIKEYKFSEVAEILIGHLGLITSSNDDIIILNKYLLSIYLSENNPSLKWSGTPVFVIDKSGNKKLAKDLYFGKDYGNPLTEEIYKYDKSKIIASSAKMRIDLTDDIEFKKYLEWLGVAYFPRKINVKGETDYADYVMKNYNYKNKAAEYYFKDGYKEFKEAFKGYSSIIVSSIDDIENVLKNNSCEKIFQLVDKVDYVFNSLDKDVEPHGSYLTFWAYSDRNTRQINGIRMKSYLKWKISNYEWLNTENNKKSAPSQCSTASYVNEDFQGLVEKVKIDYDELKRQNIQREKAEYLLNIVGVHKTINTFSTTMLYSILLKLPEIDIDGKKAKTIYNQLAVQYDDKLLDKLDKTDLLYIKFHQSGKVYCKNGTYIPINDAYYVNDKRYGDAIIKQFHMIEIDRRRGKEKVKKLFGVRSLTNITLDLEGVPLFHNLNDIFETELNMFKPYVYVLRKDIDTGTERNTIKDTKFKLVDRLDAKLTKDSSSFITSLNDYEYFYLKARNTIFIKAPDGYDEIPQLKDDIHFCSAVAEAFSAMLDVDAQRQQIRELFSKSNSARDELLRSELEDNSLEKLKDARNLLEIINNPKIEFWKSFAKCFKNKTLKLKNETEVELFESLTKNFAQHKLLIDEVFSEINYQELNEVVSLELILKLFKAVKITIKQFNEFHSPPLNMKELYEIYFKKELDNFKLKFKSLYYDKCLNNDDLKKTFDSVINTYTGLRPAIINDVYFDANVDLFHIIENTFDIDMLVDVDIKDFNQIYERNLSTLWEVIKGTLKEKSLFDQFLKENPIVYSLLYFQDQINAIEERLKLWLGKNNSGNGGNEGHNKTKRISFGNQTILYDDFKDLKAQLDLIVRKEELKKMTINPINIIKAKIDKKDLKTGGINQRGFAKPKVPKEEIGFLGEYLVYHQLLETINAKDSVKWVSEYARDCGINLDGKNGLGYDIEYIPNGAKYPKFVEVKVVGWDDAFHITSPEVVFGEANSKKYEVFLVRNLEVPTSAKIEKIIGLFDYDKGKSFTDNELFSVVNDNFVIKFKKQ